MKTFNAMGEDNIAGEIVVDNGADGGGSGGGGSGGGGSGGGGSDGGSVSKNCLASPGFLCNGGGVSGVGSVSKLFA